MIRRDRSLFTAGVAIFVVPMLFATPGRCGAQDPVAGQRGADAGRGQPRPGPQNLQVLPKETPQAQVLQTMQAFTAALGVQCVHCHVQAGGGRRAGRRRRGPRPRRGGAPAFDYASDDKPQKKAARQMMLMVREINPKVVAAVGKAEDMTARVGCVTCHRGVAIPRPLTEILDLTTAEKGAPAAHRPVQGSAQAVLRRPGLRFQRRESRRVCAAGDQRQQGRRRAGVAAAESRVLPAVLANLHRAVTGAAEKERQGGRDQEPGKGRRARSAKRADQATAGSVERGAAAAVGAPSRVVGCRAPARRYAHISRARRVAIDGFKQNLDALTEPGAASRPRDRTCRRRNWTSCSKPRRRANGAADAIAFSFGSDRPDRSRHRRHAGPPSGRDGPPGVGVGCAGRVREPAAGHAGDPRAVAGGAGRGGAAAGGRRVSQCG